MRGGSLNAAGYSLAESLGGVESLISLPALMTHDATAPEVRASLGASERLIRISVGIEDAEDLKRNLGGPQLNSADCDLGW